MFASVALALLASSAAPAPGIAPAAAAPASPAVKQKRVCHVDDAVIGSLTPKRVCVTVQQPGPVSAQGAGTDAAAGQRPAPTAPTAPTAADGND